MTWWLLQRHLVHTVLIPCDERRADARPIDSFTIAYCQSHSCLRVTPYRAVFVRRCRQAGWDTGATHDARATAAGLSRHGGRETLRGFLLPTRWAVRTIVVSGGGPCPRGCRSCMPRSMGSCREDCAASLTDGMPAPKPRALKPPSRDQRAMLVCGPMSRCSLAINDATAVRSRVGRPDELAISRQKARAIQTSLRPPLLGACYRISTIRRWRDPYEPKGWRPGRERDYLCRSRSEATAR
ncbi:uncharacterized protein B0I36DRAFT_31968 [Microdochium trichocladiopsis]|uniref:Uncharacterized protein n=1 Tax=Microdochium trichocladiopsis TaxID=1682393 RepID=A0A9P8XWY2_9PEZI|nr:uncharacterized protein B0I36DRAFT_31968 [Microdochium trichocladiopsis]KAH7021426.1 hypothetical protein B0I36DRAFT_31968 [Microdochium trichocladiopsis]